MSSPNVSLVLAGGVALGAYEAGAYAALHAHRELWPGHLAASSIGAINAALIAGGPPQQRVARLQAFWDEAGVDLGLAGGALVGPWRHASNWLAVLHTRVFGRTGQFRPRLAAFPPSGVPSVYDLEPLRSQIAKYVDFERLNAGAPRLSIMTTDIETGEAVVFDTATQRVGPDHILASCGFLPDFPPLEIDGRLLGDGGLVANAPVELALAHEGGEQLCFVVDLFSSRGARPTSLEQAAARRWDLLFGNQTRAALRSLERAHAVRAGAQCVRVLHLAYRAPPHEPGPERPFDYSRATLTERWQAGRRDMEEAIAMAAGASARNDGLVAMSVWHACALQAGNEP